MELQNGALSAVVAWHLGRFLGVGTLPMQAPAADELRRTMQTLGLRSVQIGSHVNGRNLDDPALESFWATAHELGAFVLIHPRGTIIPGDRLAFYYRPNFVGLPLETTIAGASLVFGGVLAFPKPRSASATLAASLFQTGRLVRAENGRRRRASG